jgi:glutamate racemase
MLRTSIGLASHPMTPQQPIGIFDSGLGGLSVARHIRALLPAEDLRYVADSAHIPYGAKPAAFVIERSLAIGEFLLEQGAKAIVVACNTATAAAVTELRARFDVPIVAMEPGVKPAVELTLSGVVGVLATEGTLGSLRFRSLVERYGSEARVVVQPCHGWVEQVESGELGSAEAEALVHRTVEPLLRLGADTLVLGCTHYPFLVDTIRKVAGDQIGIIDTGGAVARELKRRLAQAGLLREPSRPGEERFWTSGEVALVRPMLERLWGLQTVLRKLPAAFDGSIAPAAEDGPPLGAAQRP